MNVEAVREMLNQWPFEPFEVVMSSGERHVVKHPEFAILMASRLIVADPVADQAYNSVLHPHHRIDAASTPATPAVAVVLSTCPASLGASQ